jgi:nicotinamidase-related amidase
MEERTVEANNKSIIIGNTTNFWRYSSENGFDLTRQNDHQTCSSISLQTATTPILIDPTRSALVIIDMQNFFLHPSVRAHDTGLAASKKLLEYAIPAARKAGIQIIWLNWGLTEEDIDQAPPGLKRVFARGIIGENKTVPSLSSKTVYNGFGSEMGDIPLPSDEYVKGGRLLMRDTWNAKLYDPLFQSYKTSLTTTKPDQWFHKVSFELLHLLLSACLR